ncbi:SusC/RagA family TonB-linked outer membrane protein [Rufibacter latericius]|uniref:TonB-dependent receptor n=1 Tax=Rufibacter latericius TaxID=2487040 RepID=A0A3M9ML32_9BACT|nr:TonB-dependent receptor [Rufibacter latericius]RNI26191.1 TonB-dependent receptor [Rufibacter latericius]
MKKALLFSFALVLALITQAWAQSRTVTGRVTDAQTGEGMPGVTVQLKGSTTAAPTDVNGAYSINVPTAGGTLVFSFIGYTNQEVAIGSQTTINARLTSDARSLSEVVVTGYQSLTKSEITGSVATVSSEKIADRPLPSVEQILQGQVAGLQSVGFSGQPGATQQIRIRGIGSINAGSNPLYVVDGVILNTGDVSRLTTTSNQLAGLNPNDIESVNVLKDAASTAIYGSRGANGVILITTKKGRSGKTKFNASGEYGYTEIAKLPEAGQYLNSDEWLTLTQEGLVNNGGYTPAEIQARILALGGGSGVYTDWFDLVTRKGNQQTYNLSASGGDERTQFYVSGGYFKQEAPVIGSDLQRVSGTLNLSHKVSDKVSFFNTLNLSNVNQHTPSNGGGFSNPVGSAAFLLPTQRPYNDDGTINISRAGTLGYTGNFNPLYLVENDKRELRNAKAIGSIGAEWSILQNLKFTSKVGVDYTSLEEEMFWNPFHGDGRTVSGRGYNYFTRLFNWIATNQLNYRFKVPGFEKIGGDATLAYEAQKSAQYNITTNATGYPITNALPASAVASTPVAGNGSGSDYTFNSIISALNLNYEGKYVVSGTFRRDGSSRFGSTNRYGNFWSVGASWNVHEEAFMEAFDYISTLKLRTSYGVNGNGDIGNYTWRPTFGYGVNYNSAPGGAFNNLGNIDLTWEQNKPFDAGIDLGFFSDRLNLSFDYYERTTSDMLLNRQISRTTGFSSVLQNIGEMKNTGVEFTISGYPIDGAFKWNTNFNIAFNKNRVTKLVDGADIIDGAYLTREGYDYRTFYVRQWAGVDPQTGNPQWWKDAEKTEKTTVYSQAVRVPYKSASPKFFGGFNNTFSYAGVTLDALVVYNFGNYVRDGWEAYLMDGVNPLNNKYKKVLDRWQKPGDVTDVPKYVYSATTSSNSFSTRYLYKGDYIRLRNLSLGYDLKPEWISGLGFSKVNVYVRGTNLFTKTFDENLPIDPEAGVNSSSNSDIPMSKSLTFGLNVNF